jgi:hypothetical protein
LVLICDLWALVCAGKKSKVRDSGDDLIDSSNADSVGSSSTALSDQLLGLNLLQ